MESESELPDEKDARQAMRPELAEIRNRVKGIVRGMPDTARFRAGAIAARLELADQILRGVVEDLSDARPDNRDE